MTQTQSLTFKIDGLNCASCVTRVEKGLNAVEGLHQASVNLATKSAQTALSGADSKDLQAALIQIGYPARESKVDLQIQGMSCAACAARSERALQDVPGVLTACVNFATHTAHVRYLDGATDPKALASATANAGYPGTVQKYDQPSPEQQSADEVVKAKRLTLISFVLALPVFAMEMGGHFIPGVHSTINGLIGQQNAWLIQFVLTTAIMIGPGVGFFRVGVPKLFRRAPDMNSLVALGTLAAWGYSSVAVFAPQVMADENRAVYFEGAAVIVTLILMGRWLETRARGRSGSAIAQLARLQPRVVSVDQGGEIVEKPVDTVAVGDIIAVKPGERIALDGQILTGSSFVDESMITGEAAPVGKTASDQVIGGTINGFGALRVTVQKVGHNTMLAQIIAMVQQAQGAKLPIQTLADKVVLLFVPVVLAIAALTVAAWLVLGPEPSLGLALVAGVSVLIIACPCAMGLATPISVMVGTGRGAQMGVLFRKGDSLQTLETIKVIAFDKTGTLTIGRPTLTDFQVAKGFEENTVLRLVASAEQHSEHPIATAIITAAKGRDLTLSGTSTMQAIAGFGLRATVDSQEILIGTAQLMHQEAIDFNIFNAELDTLQQQSRSPVLVAIDGKIAALIGVADPIKLGAVKALTTLRENGVELAMITGDAKGTAQAIATELGISQVEAEVLPEGKRDAVERLRATFGPVAFVGDGINDAPALAAADVGIAMGTGTDIAIESADVVLMSGDLVGVVNAFDLSGRVLRNIRQNLFWAFAYNAALIPVAAGVLYPFLGVMLSPMLAASAMALSSVFVISNALRLRGIRPTLPPVQAA